MVACSPSQCATRYSTVPRESFSTPAKDPDAPTKVSLDEPAHSPLAKKLVLAICLALSVAVYSTAISPSAHAHGGGAVAAAPPMSTWDTYPVATTGYIRGAPLHGWRTHIEMNIVERTINRCEALRDVYSQHGGTMQSAAEATVVRFGMIHSHVLGQIIAFKAKDAAQNAFAVRAAFGAQLAVWTYQGINHGLVHGFTWWRVATSPEPDNGALWRWITTELCELGNASAQLYWNCLHGVGHGVLAREVRGRGWAPTTPCAPLNPDNVTMGELRRALDVCRAADDLGLSDAASGCAEGLFHAYFEAVGISSTPARAPHTCPPLPRPPPPPSPNLHPRAPPAPLPPLPPPPPHPPPTPYLPSLSPPSRPYRAGALVVPLR